jgi:hypothetical protein
MTTSSTLMIFWLSSLAGAAARNRHRHSHAQSPLPPSISVPFVIVGVLSVGALFFFGFKLYRYIACTEVKITGGRLSVTSHFGTRVVDCCKVRKIVYEERKYLQSSNRSGAIPGLVMKFIVHADGELIEIHPDLWERTLKMSTAQVLKSAFEASKLINFPGV